MDTPARYHDLPEYAFPRLRRLIAGVEPGNPDTISMSIGEPRHPFPDFVPEILARESAGLSRYPPIEGIAALREAISAWLGRRYGVAEAWRDPETMILPLNGTREGLFNTVLALSPERKAGQRPAVLLPNPFYQCYAVAALTAGADPAYLPATEATGHLPDFDALPEALLARTTVAFLCSPANPQGAVADRAYWTRLLALAERHDFTVFADECYSEIFRDTPPTGALEAAAAAGADPERLVIFHSLSKRSSLPGLRSGFLATGPGNAAVVRLIRSYSGAPLPLPVQHASAAAWADEAHVVANRALYQEKFTLADHILGEMSGYSAPEGGFFLWLRTGDGERSALRLWREGGVLALPGAYLSRPVDPPLGGGDPGADYLRLALVAPAEVCGRGLRAVRDVLG